MVSTDWGKMLNGVNNKEDLLQAQVDKQLGVSSVATNPIKNPYKNIDSSLLIDETAISNEALKLYEKEQDVKKFNQLAMTDPNDVSHEEIIANLFDKGVIDPHSDEVLSDLVNNNKLLNDLGL